MLSVDGKSSWLWVSDKMRKRVFRVAGEVMLDNDRAYRVEVQIVEWRRVLSFVFRGQTVALALNAVILCLGCD